MTTVLARIIPGRRKLVPVALGVLWIGASCAGLALLAMYAARPGTGGAASGAWPGDSRIARGEGRDTLVVFAHPQCACTRATLSELERILAHSPKPVTTWVVFFSPEQFAAEWEDTELVRIAKAIPGVRTARDAGGEEASRFGATTSGQTMLYDERGKLLFQGGITAARGHEGDNDGRAAIESYLAGDAAGIHETPVFGCPIAVAADEN